MCSYKTIDIKVIKGTYGITSTVAPTISPLNTAVIKVTVDTDDDNVAVYFNIKKSQLVTIYTDEIMSNQAYYNYIDDDRTFKGLVLEVGKVYYFDKMQVYVNDVKYSYDNLGNLISIEYELKSNVLEKYLYDDNLPGVYEFNFAVIKYDKKATSSVTTMTVNRQEITGTSIEHYASVDLYSTNQNVYERNDYYQDNTLVSGYPGMIIIDMEPSYANVDYVEIISASIDGYYISLEQLVKVYDDTNTYFNGFYTTYTHGREIIDGGRGIRIGKYSNLYNDGTDDILSYDGKFYIRTLVQNVPVGTTDFTITYNSYYKGELQEYGSGSITISVTRYSSSCCAVCLRPCCNTERCCGRCCAFH